MILLNERHWSPPIKKEIDDLKEELNTLSFEDIDGILSIEQGGTGTNEPGDNLLGNIGWYDMQYDTIVVDVNAEAEDAEFFTIQSAIDAIPKYLISNVTILIHGGTYEEDITISGFCGIGILYLKGAAEEIVTIKGKTKIYNNMARITITHATAPSSGVAPYMRFTGATGITATSSLIEILNSNYVTIQYCYLLGISMTSDYLWRGVYVNRGSNVYITRCYCRRLTQVVYVQPMSFANCVNCYGGVSEGTALSSSNYQNNYAYYNNGGVLTVSGTYPGSVKGNHTSWHSAVSSSSAVATVYT